MRTLEEINLHIGTRLNQEDLDRLRKLPEWHIAYALGSTDRDRDEIYCDFATAVAILITLTVRKAPARVPSHSVAFLAGWFDSGRSIPATGSELVIGANIGRLESNRQAWGNSFAFYRGVKN